MSSASYSGFFLSAQQLWSLIGTPQAPMIFDVRRREIYDAAPGLVPTATWREPESYAQWVPALSGGKPIVLMCHHGHNLSQMVAADLRQRGIAAQVLEGGYQAWGDAGLPLTTRSALDRFTSASPSLWVTRRRPKIDRVACPWLIRRFLDADACILYVDPPEVPAVAKETGAVPFDIEGIEISHEDERCSFDTMLKLFGLEAEPSLARLALIVRGADTGHPELAPQSAGLLAVSLGLSANFTDDHGMLAQGLVLYDALYAWCRSLQSETHNWKPAA